MKKIVIAGIILLISISPLFRGLFFEYESYGFLAVLALLSVIYLLIKIAKREPLRINKLYVSVGMFLIAAVCFSFAHAVNYRKNLDALLLYLSLLLMFIVLYDFFCDKKKQFIQAIMLPAVLVGTVAGFVGMVALTGNFNIWNVTIDNNRLGTTFQYANTASVYFIICYIFAMTLANSYKNRILRSLMTGLGNILIFAFFMTGSRGGYIVGAFVFLLFLVIQPSTMKLNALIGMLCSFVPVFIVLKRFNSVVAAGDNLTAGKWIVLSFILSSAAYFVISLITDKVIRNEKRKTIKCAGIAFIIFIATSAAAVVILKDSIAKLLPPVIAHRLGSIFIDGLKTKNFIFRVEFDKDALKLIASHWLFGLGGGGWKALYQSVQDLFYTAATVHNHYLQIFVDHGILGFASYMALFVITTASAVYSCLQADDKAMKSSAVGLLCGFIALAVHSALDFNLSYTSMVLLLWVMFAASAVGFPAQNSATGSISGRTGFTRILGYAQSDRWKASITGNIGKFVMVVIGSLLFSTYAIFFAAESNSYTATTYLQMKDYKTAMAFFEEANRLDPANPEYTFELAKIYHYYGRNSTDSDVSKEWLKKARIAGEFSVNSYRNYPAYMNTLVRIYLDSDMPVEALDMAQRLVAAQKFNAEVYELLARSYIDAALYFADNGDKEKAKELLTKCLEIDSDPYLRKSVIKIPAQLNSAEVLQRYKHSDVLAGCLEQAIDILHNIE